MQMYYLFFTIFLIQSCISQPNKISLNKDSLIDESVTSYNYYQRLVGSYLKVDSLKNPFLTIDNKIDIKYCDSINDSINHFDFIIRDFFKSKFPIELGPKPEPKKGVIKILLDSVFIVKSLGDKEYFKTEPGDRTAGYYYGSILDISDNYVLCLIPYIFCCGHEYYLYSFNKKGEMIDKVCVGGFSNDKDETYGVLEEVDRFQVFINEFGFEKERTFLTKKQHFRYKISKTGKFEKE